MRPRLVEPEFRMTKEQYHRYNSLSPEQLRDELALLRQHNRRIQLKPELTKNEYTKNSLEAVAFDGAIRQVAVMTALDEAILRAQKKAHHAYEITDKRRQKEIAVLKQDLATVQTQMIKLTGNPKADMDERHVLLKGTGRKLSELLEDHEKDALQHRHDWDQQNREMDAQLEEIEQGWAVEGAGLLETMGYPERHDKDLVQKKAGLIGDKKGSGSVRTELESPKRLEKTKNSDITPTNAENKAGPLDAVVSKLLDGPKDISLNVKPVAATVNGGSTIRSLLAAIQTLRSKVERKLLRPESAFLQSPSESLVGENLQIANMDPNHLLANPSTKLNDGFTSPVCSLYYI
jgi:hypothetical protein